MDDRKVGMKLPCKIPSSLCAYLLSKILYLSGLNMCGFLRNIIGSARGFQRDALFENFLRAFEHPQPMSDETVQKGIIKPI